MSKSIHEEAKSSLKNILDYVNEILANHNLSGGLGNDYLIVKNYINQAQKQEKLLNLYREKEKHEQEFPALNNIEYEDYQRIKTKIRELENE